MTKTISHAEGEPREWGLRDPFFYLDGDGKLWWIDAAGNATLFATTEYVPGVNEMGIIFTLVSPQSPDSNS